MTIETISLIVVNLKIFGKRRVKMNIFSGLILIFLTKLQAVSSQ